MTTETKHSLLILGSIIGILLLMLAAVSKDKWAVLPWQGSWFEPRYEEQNGN